MKQAKERVWKTPEGKLVEDKEVPTGSVLFAAEGQLVPDEYLEGLKGDSFFKSVTPAHPEPVTPAPRAEEFKPGQSNAAAVKGAPQEKVGPVKVIGDVEAAVGSESPKPTKTTKAAKKSTKKK